MFLCSSLEHSKCLEIITRHFVTWHIERSNNYMKTLSCIFVAHVKRDSNAIRTSIEICLRSKGINVNFIASNKFIENYIILNVEKMLEIYIGNSCSKLGYVHYRVLNKYLYLSCIYLSIYLSCYLIRIALLIL